MAPTGFVRAGTNGRLTLGVPSKGRMAEPATAAVRRRPGSTSRRPTGRCSSRARTRRSTCCSCARTTSPSTCRTASSTSGSPAPTSSSRPARTSSRWPSSASPAARCRPPCRRTRRRRRSRDLDGLRVATAYPVDDAGAPGASSASTAELVRVSGSVEAAPRLGLSDAIVDLVSTGSTASANGLRLLGSLLESQAVLIAQRGGASADAASWSSGSS